LQRPVPPSNFRSSGNTAEDLRRIRQHQQEILDWIDNQIDTVEAEIAAIPTGVTSFNGRTGAVVPGSSDYTATQVGLGSVTNDAQLKRAGSDWSGFTTQTGSPAAGDKFLIERASDSAKRVVLASSLGAGNRDPIWDPPTTASADDDEFTTDVLALGTGGWTAALAGTPGTPMTRDGAINLSVVPASGHYRSSCIGSTLLIQIRSSETFLMWKQFAGALSTAQLWFAGVGLHNEPNSAAADYQPFSMQVYKDAAGLPDLNNRSILRWQSNLERCEVVTIAGGVTSAVTSYNMPTAPYDGMVMRVDHSTTSGLNFGGFPFRRNGTIGSVLQSTAASVRFNAATDKIGITFRSQVAVGVDPFVGPPTTALFSLHFLRRVPLASGWIAQA
jgi:hypothetical protein